MTSLAIRRAAASTIALALSVAAAPAETATPQPTPAAAEPAQPTAKPVQASVTPVGAAVLPVGQILRFRLLSLADGYASLYSLSASGRTWVWLENLPVSAGATVEYPQPDKIVRTSPPAGTDVVVLVVARRPIAGFLGPGAGGPSGLQLTHEDFRTALLNHLAEIPPGDQAVTETMIRVTD